MENCTGTVRYYMNKGEVLLGITPLIEEYMNNLLLEYFPVAILKLKERNEELRNCLDTLGN